jgi:glycosyltransferase involved in cell wall biosynthesis
VLSVAVVTPSLNQGRFIERTICSVLDQGYPALDYVICDGGSTDDTLAVLRAHEGRARVISEPDSGQAEAVNRGIRLSHGDVIGWLNSDDVYLPGALQQVATYLEAHPDVDVVYGDAQLIDAHDALIGPYYTEPWNPERLKHRCYLCQPAVFFRRAVVEHFGMLDERLHYALDYEYWLRLAAAGARFAYVPVLFASSRLYPETKTLGARLAVHAELNAMLRARLGRVPESWLLNNAHTRVELHRAAPGRHVLPYAVEVVVEAMRLSLSWNGTISRDLLASSFGPLARGAVRRLTQVPS